VVTRRQRGCPIKIPTSLSNSSKLGSLYRHLRKKPGFGGKISAGRTHDGHENAQKSTKNRRLPLFPTRKFLLSMAHRNSIFVVLRALLWPFFEL
jgi:hypothetical protein